MSGAIEIRRNGILRTDRFIRPGDQALDLDLDQIAVATVRRWRFAPGTKDGVPVNVEVEAEVSCTLRSSR